MFARLSCVTALIALIGLAHASPARAADAVKVVTPSRVIFALPYWIAERKGYFKDEGIDATIEMVPDGKAITDSLLGGTAQFSIVGPDAALIDATNGGPLRVIAGVVRKPPLFLIARTGINNFADLRDTRIGVLSLTEGSSKLLANMLKAEGIAPANVHIAAVGGAPARNKLLRSGAIDAALQPLPLNLEAEAFGFNNLGWAGKYEPEWQFTTVNANGDWARSHPRVAVGFLRALLRGQQLIWSDQNEAVRIAADALQSPAVFVDRALDEVKSRGIIDPKLDWSERGLQRIYENQQADGAIPADRKFDVSKVTDATYLRQAQASVGAKP